MLINNERKNTVKYHNYDLDALMKGPLASLFCCIGDPVIGNPTQYMMEKAFESLSLPCRYLTMNVEKENLENAIKGLKALNSNQFHSLIH